MQQNIEIGRVKQVRFSIQNNSKTRATPILWWILRTLCFCFVYFILLIVIDQIPQFDDINSNQQHRFITLIDIIYDKDNSL